MPLRVLRRRPRRRPRLDVDAPEARRGSDASAEAVVVLVHGGPERGFGPTRRWDPAYLRMLPIGAAIEGLAGDRIAVVRLRHRQTGWNGAQQTVLAEARWALDDVERRYPGVPVGVIGHSLGGRTALRLAGDGRVVVAVALAPWVPPGEPVGQLSGEKVLVVQGAADVVCPASETDAYVDRARAAGASVRYVRLPGEGHLLLLGACRTHRHVARYVVDRLLPHAD